jgi:Zn-dependent protease with chaperone function
MLSQLAILIGMRGVNVWVLPAAVLLLPIVLTVFLRQAALIQSVEAQRKRVWATYRGFGRFILAMTVASWWVMEDLHSRDDLVSIIIARWPRALETSSVEATLFWLPPTLSLGVFLFLCYTVDKTMLRLKWTTAETLRQVWWRLASFVIPLLMVAAGFDDLLDRKIRGIAWLLFAGVIARIGAVFLMSALGTKFNRLKSGELRNRALSVAQRMGVTLARVYVVPAGKGHLTNAYGMSNSIALTDNLGKYLTKAQKEFVIAHEVAHVKLKHGRKQLLLVSSIYCITSLFLFFISPQSSAVRPVIKLLAIIGPLVVLYFVSRSFEYSADGEAVEFTGDAETAIWAMVNLHDNRELPAAEDRFTELFTTHPTLEHRIQAIADCGRMPDARLIDILAKARKSASPCET